MGRLLNAIAPVGREAENGSPAMQEWAISQSLNEGECKFTQIDAKSIEGLATRKRIRTGLSKFLKFDGEVFIFDSR